MRVTTSYVVIEPIITLQAYHLAIINENGYKPLNDEGKSLARYNDYANSTTTIGHIVVMIEKLITGTGPCSYRLDNFINA